MTHRILYVGNGNVPSRWAHSVQSMKVAQGFVRCGARVTMLTQCAIRDVFRCPIDVYEWYGIRDRFRVMRLPIRKRREDPSGAFKGWSYPRFNRIAARIARLMPYDIVFTPDPDVLKSLIRARVSGIVYEAHQPPDAELPGERLAELSAIVVISPSLKDAMLAQGVDAQKILVAPDAVELEPFDSADPAPLSEQWKAGRGWRLIVGYCGHLYENRGIDSILDCASRMGDMLFVLVGGWPEDIEKWKSRYRDLANVRFEGFVSNTLVPQYEKSMDVLLMPYSAKCQTADYMSPMKLAEYMAAGKATVATDLPALKDLLRHGENALLVPPDDPEALQEAIQSLADDEKLRVKLGERARRDISGFTWQARGARILEHVDRLRDGG
jgi:glycosyltransferase involved in cell wall biosynthesis